MRQLTIRRIILTIQNINLVTKCGKLGEENEKYFQNDIARQETIIYLNGYSGVPKLKYLLLRNKTSQFTGIEVK